MKRVSRLSGSMTGLVALVLLVAAASPAVQAQQRNIPIPASSASPGGVAAASGASMDSLIALPIQNQGAFAGSWTAGFLGQRKCDTTRGGFPCVWITSDGNVSSNYKTEWSQEPRTSQPPPVLSPVTLATFATGDSCDGGQCDRYVYVEPTLNGQAMQLNGGTPNGWRFRYGRPPYWSNWFN